MSGWLSGLVMFFGLWDPTSVSVDAFVEPSAELGLGITTISASRPIGDLQLQVGAEAEWDLHDATLVPLDVALVWSDAPASWLSLYGGVATGLEVERIVSESPSPATSYVFSAALRAGASISVSQHLAVSLDVEWSVPVGANPTPEMIVELGPSFSF